MSEFGAAAAVRAIGELPRPGEFSLVLGAPGSGKTTAAVELIAEQVRSGALRAEQVLLISGSRQSANQLRTRLARAVGGTTHSVLARTMPGLAFALLRADAALRGAEPPRLLTGPEQEVIVRELLEGHASGELPGPAWPQELQEAVGTRGFRRQLRDFLMRAVEHGVDARALAQMGEQHGQPGWVAAAQVMREYDEVTALSTPGGFDPAWVCAAAADVCHEDAAAAQQVRASLRLLVIDDAQELTQPATDFLRALASNGGPAVVLFGDPDVACQTFRGADPSLMAGAWPLARTVLLPSSHRLGGDIADAARRVGSSIGVVGEQAQRQFVAAPREGAVEVHHVGAVSQEGALIAQCLRRAHLRDGIPYSQMAVIARGSQRSAAMKRSLERFGVPVTIQSSELPLRDDPVAGTLLTLVQMACEREGARDAAAGVGGASDAAAGADPVIELERILAVMGSPLVGADASAIRALRRCLRAESFAEGHPQPSDALIVAAVTQPERLRHLGPDAHPILAVARMLAAGREALAEGGTAPQVLWAIWDAAKVAKRWQRTAVEGGAAGLRADRRLDAALALFDAAGRMNERLPGIHPRAFVEHVLSLEDPTDSLARSGSGNERVSVLTPAAAAGREFRIVAVAGVQEGVWPDLRVRGSLLHTDLLVDLLHGRRIEADPRARLRNAISAVRHDETRLFYLAITRASERLLVTAVANSDEQPSSLLSLVDPTVLERPATEVAMEWDLPSLVGRLRRDLVMAREGHEPQGQAAAAALTHLAQAGVAGAHPSSWWSLREVSDSRPLIPAGELVPISPSGVESFNTCGLRWLLTTRGGSGPSVGAATLGTLVHEIAALDGPADEERLQAELDQRWPRLGLPSSWISAATRKRAQWMVHRYANYVEFADRAGWRRLAAEADMSATIGAAQLRGRIDRIEVNDAGQVRVIDLKTGSKAAAKEVPEHPQLGCYQLGALHGGIDALEAVDSMEVAGAALLHVGGKSGPSRGSPATNLQLQDPVVLGPEPTWVEELVAQTAEGMSAAAVAARVNDHCPRCPVRTCCPVNAEGGRLV